MEPVGRYGSIDNLIEENGLKPGNSADKKAFTYFVMGGARLLYATAARLTVISLVSTLSASADVLAMSSVEVDLDSIPEGALVTVKFRGKVSFLSCHVFSPPADSHLMPPLHPLFFTLNIFHK